MRYLAFLFRCVRKILYKLLKRLDKKIVENTVLVGSGTVVTKSIPSNQIWAGNPAKFIKNI